MTLPALVASGRRKSALISRMEVQEELSPAGQVLLDQLYREREQLRQDYRLVAELAALPYRLHSGISSIL